MRRSIAAVALAALLAPVATAVAHEGNPNFSSTVRGVTPRLPGVTVQVLNGDDRLLLVNRGDRDVVIHGYNREPYARVAADGTVEVNRRSPAFYLNQERFGGVKVPAAADAKAAPDWQQVGRSGRFEWHDHRMHWMGEGTPPQVKDEGTRTKVFDWTVPLRAEGSAGAITGTLTWVPTDDGGPPIAAIVAFAVIVLAGVAAVVVVRRRRDTEEAEAW
jgi:hypothetical protein